MIGKLAALQFVLVSVAAIAQQQPIGSVGVQEATVAGALEITNGRAILVGSTVVTAKDHTAEVALKRGGKILVCATSGLHLTAGKMPTGGPTTAVDQPLMLSLDRGAIEVQMAATATDVLMTPDLRFTTQGTGPLDLRLRVTRNGDTCVENRGKNAPALHIVDQFGDGSYDVRAGQHVLFEHGKLKEVVDRETSPCGCPPEPVVSVADAGGAAGSPAAPGSVVAPERSGVAQERSVVAPEQHPFPAAVSQGLAPDPAVPAAPTGVVHAQVSTTLSYGAEAAAGSSGVSAPAGADTGSGVASRRDGAAASGTSGAVEGAGTQAGDARRVGTQAAATQAVTPGAGTQDASSSPQGTVRAEAPLPPAPPSPPDIAHRIGHFFKRLFGKR